MINNLNNTQIMYNRFCPYTIQNIYCFNSSELRVLARIILFSELPN